MSTKNQISQVLSTLEHLFSNHLVSVYLYGSSVLGGLHASSDIDLMVVVDQKLSLTAREMLTDELLVISSFNHPNKRPLEVTILCQEDFSSWSIPPMCEYMFGEWLRSDIERGNIPQAYYEPELTLLIWQARQYSRTLKGNDAQSTLPNIYFSEVQNAIANCLPNLLKNLDLDLRNSLLTLTRMWFTLQTKMITSKDAAADWAIPQLPKHLRKVLQTAKLDYLYGIEEWEVSDEEIDSVIIFLDKKVRDSLILPNE